MKLSILLGVALVATLASVSAKPSSSSVGDCTKEDEGVTYGVPSDCQQYIVCKKGQLQVKQCESKYNYDTVTAKCVKAKNATCAVEAVPEDPQPVDPEPEEPQETNEQYDYLCVKVLYGVRIHPNACDKYLVCTKEKATIEQCADGFIFVADAIECVKGNKVSCTVEREEPSTTQAPTEAPTPVTKPPKPESGESNSGEGSNESKPESGESDSGENSKEVTTEAPKPITKPPKPESGESDSGENTKESDGKYDYLCAKKLLGSVAHPETCTKYISCKKYKAKEESCKKGYSYSSKFGLCVKQNNGQCADAPQEPPATEAPTEAPTPVTKPPKPESGESDSGENTKDSDGKYDYLCAKKLLGSVVHPETCTKYITCKKYKAKEESCKKGYSYSSKFGLCVKQNNGQCADAPQEPPATEAPTEAPTPVTKPPKPESGESDSGENTKESEGKYDYLCAKKLLGSVAHPETCTKYITCKKYKAKEESCKKGYSYSSKFGLCVKQNNGQCADAPQDPPATEAPTEAPTPVTKPPKPESGESDSGENSKEVTPEAPKPITKPPKPESGESDSGENSKESEGQYDYLCAKKLLGSVAHPDTCTKYISCVLYKAKEESCKKGYSYSSKIGLCVKQNNGQCADAPQEPPATEAPTEAPTPITKPPKPESGESDSGENSKESEGQYDYLCTKKLLGSVAHPETCTKYISCVLYKAKEESCKKGYSYSSKIGLCVKQNNGQCADAPQEPPATEAPTEAPTPITKPPKPESGESDSGENSKESEGQYDYLCTKKLLGSVAHPDTCTKYISCVLYKAKEESCKKGYSYSSKIGLCVKQNNGQCADAPQEPPATEAPTEAPTPVTKPPKPESGESDSGETSKESEGQYDYLCTKKLLGSVAHPDTCTKYISCVLYKAKEESCKKGYSYSSKIGLCVKQNNGQCADAPQEPPTTEAPTEAPTKPESGETGESSGEAGNETPGKYDYICENVASGKRAHPESCTKYISCKKSKAKEESCKKGRYFSVYLQTCIKGNSETCAQGNGNGGSSTSEPTTVTEPSTTETFTTKAPTTVTEPPTTEAPTTEAPITDTEPPTTEAATTKAPITDTEPPITEASTTEAPTTVTELPTTEESIPELTPPGTGGDPMQPTVECVEGFTGYLPIENDCSKYVYCFQGEPGERTCMEEYIYYHPFKACLPGDPVLCQLYSV